MIKKARLQSQKSGLDLGLLLTVLGLVIFGLIMVYDASVVQGLKDFKDSYYYIRQQGIWVGVGLLSLVFFNRFDYRRFKLLALPLILMSFIILLAVFIPGLGVSGGGAHRWLKFGPVTIQPAEIIKLTGVIFLAAIFEKGVRLIPFLILVGVVTVVTAVLQKDLGSTIVFVATSALIYFASGGPIWQILVSIPFAAASLALLIFTSDYRSKRILAFLDPFSDTQGFTYHISQVLIALGSGGLFGLGLGHSRQKFEYIPEVTTDSIFGIVGEELGFVGSTFLISLFVILIIRGFKIAQNCTDPFGKILALGLTCWLGIQVIINLSSMTALLPLTGVPLPFISYGGSALVANLTAVGILLNISKQTT
ncbi:MAG: cell division protein FtsW [Microgenomates group bacterium Gr01-1014_7]|nr:MAG: cell division protein FtsW [Microgenomates group bacterium Gr01-1014_7]